ncbi:MAG: VCBS repeat-containing protein [Cyclobacteriaceae bacterium]
MLALACGQKKDVLFELLSPDASGVRFENSLVYSEQLNPYTYKNFYNGGGVGIGDINNDGLADVFFCGNMVSNKLYLNKGNMRFEDITQSAGLETNNVWSSGVSMVDINADGLLDIYVCKSGPPGGPRRYNELFINNGDLTFDEGSKQWGLDNEGLSSHAAFFDYDRDGDLDCYLLNNSIKSVGGYDLIKDQRLIPDSLGGNKLLKNEGNTFVDVSETAGIYTSEIGFGLGVTVGDVNQDNWPDIYVSNDFFERDYLYINQQNGTFEENLDAHISELSMGSMGADFADINNDGLSEIFVTEMLPERHDRLMSKAIFESWDKHQLMMDRGYFNQFGRNVLQLQNADGTFSEIGRYAGVEATDWSWGALIFDMDNDGAKDIFVANGIYKDLLDLDYVNFMSKPGAVKEIIQTKEEAIKSMIDMMPSESLSNYAFQNNGDLTFTNQSEGWGLGRPTFSSGSAYGDLDNDGDLDLVVNNVNMPSAIYKNNSTEVYAERNYIGIKLKGIDKNINAIGAKIKVFANDKVLYQELNPFRGFESTVDNKLIFGLGEINQIDSLIVVWPNGSMTILDDVTVNQVLTIDSQDSKIREVENRGDKVWFREIHNQPAFVHKENDYVDFDMDRLLNQMSSTEGPCSCVGDVNGDGLDDFYIGGASGQHGQLFVQQNEGEFSAITAPFEKITENEDQGCVFFDANGDERLDLYVASGGGEFGSISHGLNDILYFNDGAGQFSQSSQRLPQKGQESSSCVLSFDYDQDGDMDLFVGGRQRPFYYGVPTNSHVLKNNGEGLFENVTEEEASGLLKIGMVTDAVATDLDNNGYKELVLVGKWMSPRIFEYDGNTWNDVSQVYGLSKTSGLYNTVSAADVNGDGLEDLIFGNYGLNTRFHASQKEPLGLLVNDFDNNGTLDLITTMYFEGEEYPFVQLKDLVMQLPGLKKNYLKFSDYKNATIEEVFGSKALQRGYHHKVNTLESFVWLNSKLQEYQIFPLPARAQLFPIYAVSALDIDGDGHLDLQLGGNLLKVKPEIGSYMADYGTSLLGRGNGTFKEATGDKTGISIKGEVRSIARLKIAEKEAMIFGVNDQELRVYVRYE